MAFLPLFEPQGFELYRKEDYRNSPEHVKFTNRLRKTLYYGKTPTTDRPSLPLTDIAVNFFQDAAPKEFGRLDKDYASFVSRRSCMSPCSMMLGMMYIDRLKHRNPEYLQTISSSDLFLISLMVASKYMYDEGVDEEVFNDEWAESAKMETEDLNELERNFLGAINWNLFTRPSDFADILNRIEKRIAIKQGVDRGWFSYTDLYVLTEDLNYLEAVTNLARELSKMVLVCAVAYTAGILTLVGSTVIVTCLHTQMSLDSASTLNISHTLPPEPSNSVLPIQPSFEEPEISDQTPAMKDYIPGLTVVIMMKQSVTTFFATLLDDGNFDGLVTSGFDEKNLPSDKRCIHGPCDLDLRMDKSCEYGPCASDSGIGCRNVTKGAWKNGLRKFLEIFKSQPNQCASRATPDFHSMDSALVDHERDGLGSDLRCCCKFVERGRHKPPLSDAMVGLRTGVPVF